MHRIHATEILDSDACSPAVVDAAMRDLSRVNRWFGGVTTARAMLKRVAAATRTNRLSLLEVGAGTGEVPRLAAARLAPRGIALDITLLDRVRSHLPTGNRSIVGDALALPFPDSAFDVVSCTLFAHHLDPPQLLQFIREGLRVSRCALLINDLVRHPLHLALVYTSFPVIHSRVAWLDGLTSVRRSYVPDEICGIISSGFPGARPHVEISRHYLYRMGVIVWKRDCVES